MSLITKTHSVNIIGVGKTAFLNFTFMTGWYVWIMRLFFIVALCAPLVSRFTKSLKLTSVFIIVVLVLNEFLVLWIGEDCPQNDWKVILEMNIPYLVVFCIGSYINKMSRSSVAAMMIISMLAFTTLALITKKDTGELQSLAVYKYPPQAYYMTYGISMALLLWLIRGRIVLLFDKIKILGAVEFIGSHTMWIYFWHIFILVYVAEFITIAAIRFLVVFVFSCLLTYVQSLLVKNMALRFENESTRKKLLMLFNS